MALFNLNLGPEYYVDPVFSIERIQDKDVFFQKNFISYSRVSEEDFYGMQRLMYKIENGKYILFPKIANTSLDKLEYLTQKADKALLYNWDSDFGKRVRCEVKIIRYDGQEKEYYIPRFVDLDVSIYNEATGNVMYKNFETRIPLSVDNFRVFNYSEKTWGLIFSNAMNGNLQTVKDNENLLKSISYDFYLEDGWDIYECDECHKKFTSYRDFFCHLATEGHMDSFLDSFPNDREVIRLKEIIKERKKEILLENNA